jgi:hypothetical protein
MRRDSILFGLTLLATFAGLGMVLYGEWIHTRPLVYVGGFLVLGAIGLMTGALAKMEDAEGSSH